MVHRKPGGQSTNHNRYGRSTENLCVDDFVLGDRRAGYRSATLQIVQACKKRQEVYSSLQCSSFVDIVEHKNEEKSLKTKRNKKATFWQLEKSKPCAQDREAKKESEPKTPKKV